MTSGGDNQNRTLEDIYNNEYQQNIAQLNQSADTRRQELRSELQDYQEKLNQGKITQDEFENAKTQIQRREEELNQDYQQLQQRYATLRDRQIEQARFNEQIIQQEEAPLTESEEDYPETPEGDLTAISEAQITEELGGFSPDKSTYSHREFEAAQRTIERMQQDKDFTEFSLEERRALIRKARQIQRQYETLSPEKKINELLETGASNAQIDRWLDYYQNHKVYGQEALNDKGEMTRRAKRAQKFIQKTRERLADPDDNINDRVTVESLIRSDNLDQIQSNLDQNRQQKDTDELTKKTKRRKEKRKQEEKEARRERRINTVRGTIQQAQNTHLVQDVRSFVNNTSQTPDERRAFGLILNGIKHLLKGTPIVRTVEKVEEIAERVEEIRNDYSTRLASVGSRVIGSVGNLRTHRFVVRMIDRTSGVQKTFNRLNLRTEGPRRWISNASSNVSSFYNHRVKPIGGAINTGIKATGRGLDYASSGFVSGLAPAAALGLATAGNPVAMAIGFSYGAGIKVAEKIQFDRATDLSKKFTNARNVYTKNVQNQIVNEMVSQGVDKAQAIKFVSPIARKMGRSSMSLKVLERSGRISNIQRRLALYAQRPDLVSKLSTVPRRFSMFKAGGAAGVGALVGVIIAPQLGIAAGIGAGVAAVGAGTASYIASRKSAAVSRVTSTASFKGLKSASLGGTIAAMSVGMLGGNALVAGGVAAIATGGLGYAAARFNVGNRTSAFLKSMKSPAMTYLNMADSGAYFKNTLDRLSKYDGFWDAVKGETFSANGVLNAMYLANYGFGLSQVGNVSAWRVRSGLNFASKVSPVGRRTLSNTVAQMPAKISINTTKFSLFRGGAGGGGTVIKLFKGLGGWAKAGAITGTIIGSIVGLALGGGAGAVLGASLGATIGTVVGTGAGVIAWGVTTIFTGFSAAPSILPFLKAGSFIGGNIGGIIGGVGGAKAEQRARAALGNISAAFKAVLGSINVFNAFVSLMDINFKKWNITTVITVAFSFLPLMSLISQSAQNGSIHNVTDPELEENGALNFDYVVASEEFVVSNSNEVTINLLSKKDKTPNVYSNRAIQISENIDIGYWNLYNKDQYFDAESFENWQNCMTENKVEIVCNKELNYSKDLLYWPIEFIQDIYLSNQDIQNIENYSNLKEFMQVMNDKTTYIENGFNIENIKLGSIALISTKPDKNSTIKQIGIISEIDRDKITILEVNSSAKINLYIANKTNYTNINEEKYIIGFINSNLLDNE